MWYVWDKSSTINGFLPSDFLARKRHLQNEETIFLKTVDGRVTQVEGKGILASVYGINPTLSNDEFIAEYERIVTTPVDPELELET